jgi:hypothetical protein
VLVDKTPDGERSGEGDDDLVKLTFVKPEPAPEPVAVGGGEAAAGDEEPEAEQPPAEEPAQED